MTSQRFLRRVAAPMLLAGSLAAVMAVQAQTREQLTRGELLYTTHCQACHTTQIHWRDSKLVADWDTLKRQVQRWQATAGLSWSDSDITSVALYLNKLHYGYPVDRYGQQPSEAPAQAGSGR